MNLCEKIEHPVFHLVGEAADALGRECYVVGGYVRDLCWDARRRISISLRLVAA